jgi:hypothetical protein
LTGLDEQKPSRRLWIFAAVIALALHVAGAALAIVHLQAEEADDALGASAIEVGLEMASVHREVTDLPPGLDPEDWSAIGPDGPKYCPNRPIAVKGSKKRPRRILTFGLGQLAGVQQFCPLYRCPVCRIGSRRFRWPPNNGCCSCLCVSMCRMRVGRQPRH